MLDRYRLKQPLGSGASATVWHAFDRLRRREVALKLLHPYLTADEEALRRLQAEADVARGLRHPAIISLLEAHLGGDKPALAFEYVPGQTLAAQLAREGPLEPARAARIAERIARGLAHAHARGVVHRDIKPSNVLLGSDGSVRLLDFGISGTAGRSLLTQAGTAVGTLPYMAPEQLAGQPANPASDVYSLGAVLYEMLTGNVPYQASGPAEMAEAQRTPPPVPDGPARQAASVAVAALRQLPYERPPAEELADRLRPLAAGEPDPATERMAAAYPATAMLPAAPPARRRSIGSALGAGAAAAVLGLAVAVALPELATPPAQPDAPSVTTRPATSAGMPRDFYDIEPAAIDSPAEPEPAPTAQAKPRREATTTDNKGKGGENKGKKKGKGKGDDDDGDGDD